MAQAAAAAARFAADALDMSHACNLAGDILCRTQASAHEQLAPFQYPRWIEFRADLPKTATGKNPAFQASRGGVHPMTASASSKNRRASVATRPFAEPGKIKIRPDTANGAFLGEDT